MMGEKAFGIYHFVRRRGIGFYVGGLMIGLRHCTILMQGAGCSRAGTNTVWKGDCIVDISEEMAAGVAER